MDSALTFLTGRLVSDPKIYGEDTKKRALFTVAVNRGSGEKRKASFIDCIAWGRRADIVESLSKGNTIFVQGDLEQDSYERTMDDGTVKKFNRLQVNANTILQGVPNRSPNAGGNTNAQAATEDAVELGDGVPF